MLVAIIGESCVGKSTLAETLRSELDAEVFTGKDYLRLAKNETIAKKLFQKKLSEAVREGTCVYVISEYEHLELLPPDTVRILMTADLNLIQERFARRMKGVLPPLVRLMLERKHGIFDEIKADYHIHNGENALDVCKAIICK